MANMTQIRTAMKNERRNRSTLKSIGQQYGITTGAVQRILDGAYPDEANAKILCVPVKCTACKRNMPKPKQVRRPAPKIGQDGWMDYWMKPLRGGVK